MASRLKTLMGWFTFDMLVFLVINIILLAKIDNRIDVFAHFGFLKALIFGLAAYRAANILSNETITMPLRAPFVDETKVGDKIIEQPKKKGFIGAMGTLLYCPSCTGVWLATALVYCYIFWPNQTSVVVLFLALSGFERIVANTLAFLKRIRS